MMLISQPRKAAGLLEVGDNQGEPGAAVTPCARVASVQGCAASPSAAAIEGSRPVLGCCGDGGTSTASATTWSAFSDRLRSSSRRRSIDNSNGTRIAGRSLVAITRGSRYMLWELPRYRHRLHHPRQQKRNLIRHQQRLSRLSRHWSQVQYRCCPRCRRLPPR